MITLSLLLGSLSLACGASDVPSHDSPTGVMLIAVASIPADANDLSGLGDSIPRAAFPQNRLGSLGSGIDYTGKGNRYFAACDRGPNDAAAVFFPRFHTLTIIADARASMLKVSLEHTTLFADEQGERYSGRSSAFDAVAPAKGRRLDPEGIRVSKNGSLFTSDEYGPWIDEWSGAGVHLRRLTLPPKFYVAKQSANPADELPPNNRSGRQSNRGMEGLARSPDGKRLYAVMQGPLIQDGGLDGKNRRVGTNVRVLEFDLESESTREFLYVLEDAEQGLSELLAVSSSTLLVLERDGAKGRAAASKRIFMIELAGASDISAIEKLPSKEVPAGVVPLKKTLWLDFQDPRFGLAGEKLPEKIEGLAFGPDLDDGRHLLIVSIDNDFRPGVPNWFWAFAVEPALLADFQPAAFDAR